MRVTTSKFNSVNGESVPCPVLTHAAESGLAEAEMQSRALPSDALIKLRERFGARVSYIDHPDYQNPSKYGEILQGPDFENAANSNCSGRRRKASNNQASNLPQDELWTWLPQTALLSPSQEYGLFLRYNFLKCKQNQLQTESSNLDLATVSEVTLQEFDHLGQLALADRNHILEANSRLIVSIAKKFVGSQNQLDELIAEGVFPIVRAIEHFECGRGFKFSTYATWALQRHFIRHVGQERTRALRFQPSELIDGDTIPDSAAPIGAEERAERLQSTVNWVLKEHLDAREQQILAGRFDLSGDGEETLRVVGEKIGITKERVRQLERRALEKLRDPVYMESSLEELISDEFSEIWFYNQDVQGEREFIDICAKIVLSIPREKDEGMTLSRLVDWADSQPNNDRCVDLLWKALEHLVSIGALMKEATPNGASYCLSASAQKYIEPLRRGITKRSMQATVDYLKGCSMLNEDRNLT